MAFESKMVEAGAVVTFRYKLTNENGRVVDESGDEGMPYLHGAGNIVPGLERQIQAHAVGDKFRAIVPPVEGYGMRKGPVQKVPRSKFPAGVPLEIGMELFAQAPNGGDPIPMWIVNLDDEFVHIDPSHPLAGETLTFDIEIVEVRKATEQELVQGHPQELCGHGCCGGDRDEGCCCGHGEDDCEGGCCKDGGEGGCCKDGDEGTCNEG